MMIPSVLCPLTASTLRSVSGGVGMGEGGAGIMLPVWPVCRDFAVVGGSEKKDLLTDTFSAAWFFT